MGPDSRKKKNRRCCTLWRDQPTALDGHIYRVCSKSQNVHQKMANKVTFGNSHRIHRYRALSICSGKSTRICCACLSNYVPDMSSYGRARERKKNKNMHSADQMEAAAERGREIYNRCNTDI